MIPLRDDQPTRRFPLVTVLLIVVNVIVYILQQIHPGLLSTYAMVPYRVTHPGQDLSDVIARITPYGVRLLHLPPGATDVRLRPNEIYYAPVPFDIRLTVITSMFMHASLLHLGGNMLYLWIFGNNIEDVLGKLRYLLFYFVCGIAAASAQLLTDPNSIIPALGASGAIAGVLGAYLILYPGARVLSIIPIPFFFGFLAEVPAWIVLSLWFVMQLFSGIVGLNAQATFGGVAYFEHIGGFVTGIILISLFGGKRLARNQPRRGYIR